MQTRSIFLYALENFEDYARPVECVSVVVIISAVDSGTYESAQEEEMRRVYLDSVKAC